MLELAEERVRQEEDLLGYLYVDGIVGDVGQGVLRDRQKLAEEGVVVVVVTVDIQTGKVLVGPEIITRGWVYAPEAEDLLDEAGITVNRNAVPFDPEKPFVTSGIRIGTPALAVVHSHRGPRTVEDLALCRPEIVIVAGIHRHLDNPVHYAVQVDHDALRLLRAVGLERERDGRRPDPHDYRVKEP